MVKHAQNFLYKKDVLSSGNDLARALFWEHISPTQAPLSWLSYVRTTKYSCEVMASRKQTGKAWEFGAQGRGYITGEAAVKITAKEKNQ